ncbi:hypothetical protein BVE84_01440 [Streptococcus azizii]|uniref:Type I restriction modification DNA specificity domain-containing protein n=1 Tax=Streptococcus azizii TaxID=1579424 RepID=A0AB36JTB7_9STRE|nr:MULTISPECIES: restriction endonuclease subunit S [Streptococcus]MBF0775191.1 restriction endonuclease subunit S [Streptococcus sp. 19428wD3_AN2]ONK29471.1 hypothetical protein BVE86_00130 [Streptococcus azizii]ONK29979.1 hypothetical protein BVE85_01440 [Streptococcus azizii]ONK30756.1 hypothetical protein BVE84_01440 [Streptococcus azizii]TFU84721.1 restriction endonuclease subunit S [Streptococcus sp. AN2]
MISKLQNIPNYRFKGFTDAWEQRKLGDIYYKIGNAFVGTVTPYYVEKGHFYLESNNVKNGQINYDTEVFINDEFYEKQKDKWLKAGDLVMVQSGHVGHTAVIPQSLNNLAAHALIMFRSPRVPINSYFLNYQFQTDTLKKKIDNITTGNTIKHILASDMRGFIVKISSYNEQSKIAHFFSTLDTLITLHQRECDRLSDVKRIFLQKMFPKNGEATPEFRFDGFTDAWEQRKLGDIGNTFTGLSGKTKEDFGHGEAKFITYINVFNNPIANPRMLENIEIDPRQNEVKYGDVFFTTSSETPEEVGMSSVWLENDRNIYLNSFCFGYRPAIKVDNHYLAFMLRSSSIREKMILLAQGISRYNISKNQVMKIAVSTPTLEEQIAIGSFFSTLDTLITLHQRQYELLKNMKKSLLKQMFI